MDTIISNKAEKRRKQRLRKKQKLLDNKLDESKVVVETGIELERQQNQQGEMKKNKVDKSKAQTKTEGQGKTTVTSSATTVVNLVKVIAEPQSTLKVPEKVPALEKTPEEIEKSRKQIQSEREARKLEKQQAKKKVTPAVGTKKDVLANPQKESLEKTDIKLEKKPLVAKAKDNDESTLKIISPPDDTLSIKMEKLSISDDKTKVKPVTKAERRAKQEEQRAAKAKSLEEKNLPKQPAKKSNESITKPKAPSTTHHKAVSNAAPLKTSALHKVKLFKHLYSEKCDLNINVNKKLHPAIIKLGLQYGSDSVVGSNARCYAFLNAMKILINDYETPQEKEFNRGLEAEIQPAVEFLQSCRPFAVSMTNALKHIKVFISQENFATDNDKKFRLIGKIDTYASEQIEMANIAISLKVREKISKDDVILTYGCSSLIKRTIIDAWKASEQKFKVIVVDSRPDLEGKEMLKSLTMLGIKCTYVLINAVSFVMPNVTKVLLGAHALLANGYVMSRCGTAQISLVAKSYNVPVLVCCETHKFSERVQTDAFVFNEIGDPNDLVMNKNTRTSSEYLKDWESIPHLTPLNLRYDITPPELVTAVFTEIAILPCTSVQVILRVKPAE